MKDAAVQDAVAAALIVHRSSFIVASVLQKDEGGRMKDAVATSFIFHPSSLPLVLRKDEGGRMKDAAVQDAVAAALILHLSSFILAPMLRLSREQFHSVRDQVQHGGKVLHRAVHASRQIHDQCRPARRGLRAR